MLALLVGCASSDLPYISLFTSGEDGFPCGRFPMMTEAWGKVIAVSEWTSIFGDHCGRGTDNAHATGRIAVKHSADGGHSFGAPTFVPLGSLAYARDPTVLYIEHADRLCVFFNGEPRDDQQQLGSSAGAACGNDGACTIHRQCKTGEEGAWEAPVSLAPHLDAECAGYIQGRPVGVVLDSGRLLLSTWRATFGGHGDQICVIASDDGGDTWSRAALITNSSEAAMVLLPDRKTVYLNARHTGQENGAKPWGRVTGYSKNGGVSWVIEHNSAHSPIDTAAPSPTSLILIPASVTTTTTSNNGSSVATAAAGTGPAAAAGTGTLLMALPTEGYHSMLRVFASDDGGRSWPRSVLVSAGLCYHPSLVQLPGDATAVGVAWEAEAPAGSSSSSSNCSGSCMLRFARVPLSPLLSDGGGSTVATEERQPDRKKHHNAGVRRVPLAAGAGAAAAAAAAAAARAAVATTAAAAVSPRLKTSDDSAAAVAQQQQTRARGETVGDRLWMWAHPAGFHDNYFSKFGRYPKGWRSRITPVEAAVRLDLHNIMFVYESTNYTHCERGTPDNASCYPMAVQQLPQYMMPFDSPFFKQVAYSVSGAGVGYPSGYTNAVLSQLPRQNNSAGVLFDDFVYGKNTSLQTLRSMSEKVEPLGKAVFLCLYTHELLTMPEADLLVRTR